MQLAIDLLITGLAIGVMYAMGTIALSLIWGSVGMLNVGHAALLTLGGYAAAFAVNSLGLPWWTGIIGGAAAGALGGLVLHLTIVLWIYRKPNFPINTVIATVAATTIAQNVYQEVFGAQAIRQPFEVSGSIAIGEAFLPLRTCIVLAIAAAMAITTAWVLRKTKTGLAIRAVSQNRNAAAIVGIPVGPVLVKVMMISGALSGVSGVLLTGMTTIYPTVGFDPTLRALIICAVAGLQSMPGAVLIALSFGLIEVFAQYFAGARFGFPIVLVTAVALLLWRPYGIFGLQQVTRI